MEHRVGLTRNHASSHTPSPFMGAGISWRLIDPFTSLARMTTVETVLAAPVVFGQLSASGFPVSAHQLGCLFLRLIPKELSHGYLEPIPQSYLVPGLLARGTVC